ncbi:MAG: GTPase ObgE [Defluviitaleaceae bacterium]|nr:GTPase ObgE [Defluviitaleaceae bacterium]MCL2274186.1 GTPase ObgE [Defluviitaleaceae bacterium]
MFIDHVQITIASGHGGHGHISFRREKYVPNGGPDGGDGGKGGDIVFIADTSINTLLDFRYKKKFAAQAGVKGGASKMSGKNGADLVLKVPVGTLVRYGWETENGEKGMVMADLNVAGERRVLAKGGRGGRGNQHFATPSRQAPKFCEDGRAGKEFKVTLELKLIADAGIIGFPNAGKSTLLSRVTAAKPKIANYQFTTLAPNLGVVRLDYDTDFVLADIPGLIEGASQGVGLGFDFLRHIERTRVLIHMVDAARLEAPEEADDYGLSPVEAVEKINAELGHFNPALLERPQILVANKMDLPVNEGHIEELKAYAEQHNLPLFFISGATGQGMQELMRGVANALAEAPPIADFEPDYEAHFEPERREDFITVEKDPEEEGRFIVEGPGIERMLGYTNLADERGFAFFQRFLREKGIIDKLEELGIQENDTVQLYELEFDYWK